MKTRMSETFRRDLSLLPKEVQQQAREKHKLFVENPNHPSLRIRKMQGHPDVWEGHVTLSVVFTFQWIDEEGETIAFFRRIGYHDIYDKP